MVLTFLVPRLVCGGQFFHNGWGMAQVVMRGWGVMGMACQLPPVRAGVPNGPWTCNHLRVGGYRGSCHSLNQEKLGMRTKLRAPGFLEAVQAALFLFCAADTEAIGYLLQKMRMLENRKSSKRKSSSSPENL